MGKPRLALWPTGNKRTNWPDHHRFSKVIIIAKRKTKHKPKTMTCLKWIGEATSRAAKCSTNQIKPIGNSYMRSKRASGPLLRLGLVRWARSPRTDSDQTVLNRTPPATNIKTEGSKSCLRCSCSCVGGQSGLINSAMLSLSDLLFIFAYCCSFGLHRFHLRLHVMTVTVVSPASYGFWRQVLVKPRWTCVVGYLRIASVSRSLPCQPDNLAGLTSQNMTCLLRSSPNEVC